MMQENMILQFAIAKALNTNIKQSSHVSSCHLDQFFSSQKKFNDICVLGKVSEKDLPENEPFPSRDQAHLPASEQVRMKGSELIKTSTQQINSLLNKVTKNFRFSPTATLPTNPIIYHHLP